MEMNGASLLLKALADQGIDTVFGYPGGAVLPLYDEIFKQENIRHILVRHEQAAVHAAEGYARSTGKIGVVIVTSGPGATNTITGLADALADSIPVLCISGQVATPLIGNDAFQEADMIGISSPCTKHNYLVKDISKLEKTVKEAIYVATTGRPGPVLVDFPKDIQLQTYEYRNINEVTRASYKVPTEGRQESIAAAVALMASAKRPLLYTGGGVVNAGTEASALLTRFAKLTGFPVTNTLMGLGSFPARDAQFLGMPGMHGTVEANMAMAECDVMINIGARFDDRVTGRMDAFAQKSKKIHVDIDPSSINKSVKVDIPIVGDAARVLEQFIEEWEKKNYRADSDALKTWWNTIEEWRDTTRAVYAKDKDDTGIQPQYVLETLNELLKGQDYYITTDVGQHQMWAAQRLQFDKPNRWMTSGGLGTMGYGLPAAIGAQIAHPNAKVICVSGDSSILMNIQELSTAKQYRVPVKVLILNNGYMGMVRQWQEMFHGNRYSESYIDALPDFVSLAEAFGALALRCEDPAHIKDTLEKMLSATTPVVVDMRVNREENVFPMIPSGAAHYEIETGLETPLLSKKQAG